MAAAARKKLSAMEMVTDVRAGADYAALIHKYKITAKQLKSVLTKLVEAGALENEELARAAPPRSLDQDTVSHGSFEAVPKRNRFLLIALIVLVVSAAVGAAGVFLFPELTGGPEGVVRTVSEVLNSFLNTIANLF